MTVTATYATNSVFADAANGFTTGEQFIPTVVALADGQYAFVYGNNIAAGTVAPLVTVFDADGLPLPGPVGNYYSPFTINSADVDMLGAPDITVLSNGNIVVVWDSATQGGGQIRAAILNPLTGAIVVSDFTLSGDSGDMDPEIAALDGGNWVATFYDVGGAYFKIMTATGDVVVDFQNFASAGATDPVVCTLADGAFAISWVSPGTLGDSIVMCGIIESDGNPRTAAIAVSGASVAGDNNTQPAIAATADGGFVLVYTDSGQSDGGLTMNLVSNTGTVSAAIRVDSLFLNGLSTEADPAVIVLDNGLIAVTWTYDYSATDRDIYGRLFDASGAAVEVNGSTEFFVVDDDLADSSHSTLAALLNGTFVVGWASDDTLYGDSDGGLEQQILQLTETLASDEDSDDMVGTYLLSTLFGGAGNDTLWGEAGNDDLSGGDDNDSLFGGDGTDTLNGDAGNDFLDGEAQNDTVSGGEGNDTLIGSGGYDSLNGDAGNDVISFVGYNVHEVDGGTGADDILNLTQWLGIEGFTIDLSTLSASVTGGSVFAIAGIEHIEGSALADTLTGDDQDNTLNGRGGDDAVIGGLGNDALYGDEGTDLLDGGEGNDTLLGSGARDSLSGGAGNDTYAFVGDSVHDIADSDGSLDMLTFELWTATTGVTVDLATGSGSAATGAFVHSGIESVVGTAKNDTLTGSDGGNTLIGAGGNDSMQGGSGDDELYGGGGRDTIDGGFGLNSVYGGNGNDVIQTGDAAEGSFLDGGNNDDLMVVGNAIVTMTGGSGIDTIDLQPFSYEFDMATGLTNYSGESLTGFEIALMGDGSDSVGGTAGNDTIYGGGEDDTLVGRTGFDRLEGGDGNDRLDGGVNNDTMLGGEGNDIYVVNSGADGVFETTTTASLLDAGGTDMVLSSVTLNLNAHAGVQFVENLVLTGTGNTNATGNGFSNRLTGNAGSNVLNGGLGDDTMLGGAGDDTFVVSAAGDRVVETTTPSSGIDAGGNDTVQSAVTYSIDTSTGVRFVENLTLTGTGNTSATGNGQDNTLIGNAGNNTLNGGLGSDTMLGGAGNDTYVVDAAGDQVFETTTIISNINAGGLDTVRSAVTFSVNAYDGVRFVENLTLTGGDAISAIGNALDNTLTGNTGNNTLTGGQGHDTLLGGAGNDVLQGGAGDDTLTGGGGNGDSFEFTNSYGVDTITDFSVISPFEVIDLSAVAAIVSFADLTTNHLTQVAGNAVITVGLNTLTLTGVTAASLTINEFIF